MAQVDAILEALKAQLKAHKIRYRAVADTLNLSEASVKRLFRTQGFDLPQLQRICQMMDMDIGDLDLTAENVNRIETTPDLHLAFACDQRYKTDTAAKCTVIRCSSNLL